MSETEMIHNLISEAERLYKAYTHPDFVEEVRDTLSDPNFCRTMARNSFIAHSYLAGHDRKIVMDIANQIMPLAQ